MLGLKTLAGHLLCDQMTAGFTNLLSNASDPSRGMKAMISRKRCSGSDV